MGSRETTLRAPSSIVFGDCGRGVAVAAATARADTAGARGWGRGGAWAALRSPLPRAGARSVRLGIVYAPGTWVGVAALPQGRDDLLIANDGTTLLDVADGGIRRDGVWRGRVDGWARPVLPLTGAPPLRMVVVLYYDGAARVLRARRARGARSIGESELQAAVLIDGVSPTLRPVHFVLCPGDPGGSITVVPRECLRFYVVILVYCGGARWGPHNRAGSTCGLRALQPQQ